ncbi:MAG: glycine cleavage T C-terminal barrel domain-containing protein [Minwuia sp.]|nr:glycine cleavage T C-terminal barrel domain-containing protein [Minwuia sp.]
MTFGITPGPRIRKSPYFDATVAAGMTDVTVYNHMYMPTGFGDFGVEYRRLIETVAVWDVAAERQIQVAGPDAVRLVQMLVPRDVSKMKVGQGRYALLNDANGRLINDPVLLKVADDRYWFSIADSDMEYWVAGVAAALGLDVEVSEPDVSPLAIQGPNAPDVVADLFGDWIRDLKYFAFRQTDLDGIPLMVARSGWSKQAGFELYLMDGSRGSDLWDRVMSAGLPHGIGPGAPNVVERTEGDLLSWGADTRPDANVFELGMEAYVHLDMAPDFIGKAALRRIREEGPKRRRVGLFIDPPSLSPSEDNWPVHDPSGAAAGTVSIAVPSIRLERNIAIALMDIAHAAVGTRLVVQTPDGPRDAEVTALPFIQPGG